PLPETAILEQVDEILGSSDTQLGRRVAQRADGNPFHAEELLAIESADAPLPTSLRDVLLVRLGSLDAGAIDVLGIAAVIGRDVDGEEHVAQRRWQGSVRRLDRKQLL